MGEFGKALGRLRGCTCEPWAPDEDCPHHGDRGARNDGPGRCCSPPDDRVCPPELCPFTR